MVKLLSDAVVHKFVFFVPGPPLEERRRIPPSPSPVIYHINFWRLVLVLQEEDIWLLLVYGN